MPKDKDHALHDHKPDRLQVLLDGATDFFKSYFWFIFKNVMGWVLILAAFPLGIFVPGPGGIPIFLIGFALVTLPGKRHLTSRVMSGRGLPIETAVFTFLTAFISIGVTCSLMWILSDSYQKILLHFNIFLTEDGSTYTAIGVALVGIGLVALLITWIVTRLGLKILNIILRRMPAIRRFIRPWLRRYGIHLLPARRKNRQFAANDEILELSAEHQTRVRKAWDAMRPWGQRAVSVGITGFIIWQMLVPLRRAWPKVRIDIPYLSVIAFFVAIGMFAVFLLVFRALVWRHILAAFGHHLPVAPAARIWSTSELARYVPGTIWQVLGRVFLIRPYGVSGTISSTTQVLELCIFLFANILVAMLCTFYFSAREFHTLRLWLFTAIALVPVMGFLLHPKVFYSVVNFALRQLGKPIIIRRLRWKQLIGLIAWTMFGLIWQGLAVFLIVRPIFGLKFESIWLVTGSYCLAWSAGFLAIWAPGGLGVREWMFAMAMLVALPASVRHDARFSNPDHLFGILAIISFALRLWTVLGEVLLTIVVYCLDIRGAMGYEDAPGRVGFPNELDVEDLSAPQATGAGKPS